MDIPAKDFVDALKREKADVLDISALLTTTMLAIKQTIEAIKTVGLRDRVKIIAGGAPINEGYARQVGADRFRRTLAGRLGWSRH